MKTLNIFVSSTCYDLSQIRRDMHDFIKDLGHNPYLSEHENFPINPSNKTVDNCINAVKNDADIFILIVGNRYGSLLESGKSITNLEYETAKKIGIPIYIFIDKKMLSALSFYQVNKDGNFEKFVDNVQIFDFIEQIRENDKLWTFEFEKAQDIMSTVRIQLSYLFKDCLKLKTQFNTEIEELLNLQLSNQAIKILIEKEKTYEFEFYSQTLIDEILKKENLKNDFTYEIKLETRQHIADITEIKDWLLHRNRYLHNIFTSFGNLITKALPFYLGEPGIKADLKGLYYIAHTYSKLFESLVNWSIETASTNVPDDCIEIRDKLAKISYDLIEQTWNYPFSVKEQIENLKKEIASGQKVTFNISFKVKLDDKAMDDLNNEIKILHQNLLNRN